MSKCTTKTQTEAIIELSMDMVNTAEMLLKDNNSFVNWLFHYRLRDLKTTGVLKCDDVFIKMTEEIDKMFPIKKPTEKKSKGKKKCA